MIFEVQSGVQALAVALIRNECREFMTNDTSALDVGRQLEFYRKLQKPKSASTLYIMFTAHECFVPCGYGILKRGPGRKVCLTGGLAKPFRGQGLGKALFQGLINIATKKHLRPWLTVLRSNQRAVRLYLKLGFKITEARRGSGIYTMEYKP
jgi:GNAT superfamily N-acetyltransferase